MAGLRSLALRGLRQLHPLIGSIAAEGDGWERTLQQHHPQLHCQHQHKAELLRRLRRQHRCMLLFQRKQSSPVHDLSARERRHRRNPACSDLLGRCGGASPSRRLGRSSRAAAGASVPSWSGGLRRRMAARCTNLLTGSWMNSPVRRRGPCSRAVSSCCRRAGGLPCAAAGSQVSCSPRP